MKFAFIFLGIFLASLPTANSEDCNGLLDILRTTCESRGKILDAVGCTCADPPEDDYDYNPGIDCASGYKFDQDQGRCVQCAGGGIYDPRSGDCALAPICGVGEIYSEAAGRCKDECGTAINTKIDQEQEQEISEEDVVIRSIFPVEACSKKPKKCEDFGAEFRCVESYICKNFAIVKDGSGLIDFRTSANKNKCCAKRRGVIDLTDRICEKRTEVCCRDPDFSSALLCGIHSKCQDEKEEDYKQCGRIITENQIKVNGGLRRGNVNTAQPGEFPHVCMVSLRNETSGEDEYLGGASLLDNNKVLTIAHKFLLKRKVGTIDHTKTPSRIIVRCGEYDIKHKDRFLEIQESPVKLVHVHPGYTNLKNNYAILETERNFKYQDHISPICLPQPTDSFIGMKECFSTGWGSSSLDNDDRYSDVLKKIQMSVRPRGPCEATLKEVQRKRNPKKVFKLHKTWMCVGGGEEFDTCEGDGGSPHICKVDNRWVQVGTVAFGYGCNDGNPAIYSSVAAGMCWIDYVMTCNPLAQYYTNGMSMASSETRRQASPASKNGLKASDCQSFLDSHPDLKQQCDVQYN